MIVYLLKGLSVLSELAFYHSEHAGSLDAAHATYIIGGEPRVSYLDSVQDMDEMPVNDAETDDGLSSEFSLENEVFKPFCSAGIFGAHRAKIPHNCCGRCRFFCCVLLCCRATLGLWCQWNFRIIVAAVAVLLCCVLCNCLARL